MEDFIIVAVVVAFAVFAIFAYVWHFRRGDSLLQQWAAEHGYRIMSQ